MPETPKNNAASGGAKQGMSPPLNPLDQLQRERGVILRLVRASFFIMMVTVAMLLIIQQSQIANTGQPGVGLAINWLPTLMATAAFIIIVLLVDFMTPNKKISAFSAVFLGTLTGVIATVAMGFVIDLVVRTWIPDEKGFDALRPIMTTVKVMLGISLCYLAISTVLQTQDQFRLVIPYVEFSKQLRGVRPNLLDTSALIDARISEVAATGLIQSSLVVPRFVVAELQLLADSGDRLKRGRGRRGLDVVTRLQRLGIVDVIIDETPVQSMGVDQMLVELAEKLGARIITTDLGLARVAQIKGLTAINMHDLANCLRPALVPGEQISIRLVKSGEQPGQGVGYLDDGTMVVAEGGAPYIGEEVALLVTSTMQTTAGRLVFARPVNAPETYSEREGDERHEPSAEFEAQQEQQHSQQLSQPPPRMNHPGHSGTPPVAADSQHIGNGHNAEPAANSGSPAMPEKAAGVPTSPPVRSGPFPPKPQGRRGSGPTTPRNPRRWPPTVE